MNEKNITLYISLLPLIIIVGLVLGAGYLLLGEDVDLPRIFSANPRIKRLEGFPTTLNVTEDRDKIRLVITNEEELNKFLNSVDNSGLLTLKEKVNFARKVLIGVATKTLEEEDHRFKVRKVYKDKENETLLVSLLQENPGETCNPELDKNIWIDLVEIDKTEWKIDFELVRKTIECETE